MERHAKIQPLFLQMSLLKSETAYALSIGSMQTAILCYAQPLNTCYRICTPCEYFLRLPFSATPIRILTVNKRFRTNSSNCKIFIYIHINLFVPQAPDLLEKLAESLLYNVHREHILLKLKIKKLLPKISSKNFTAGG